MSTRADEVSIHAVSPESILAASSASAGTAPPTSASAPTKTPARHGSLSLHDRFMIAMLVPPVARRFEQQPWCHGPGFAGKTSLNGTAHRKNHAAQGVGEACSLGT